MNDFFSLNGVPTVALFIIFLWSLFWRGLALWNSARHSQRNWFLIFLIVNTVGILEIIYLFGFAKKKMVLNDLMFWNKKSKESPKTNKSQK
jgi:hypothetical protein